MSKLSKILMAVVRPYDIEGANHHPLQTETLSMGEAEQQIKDLMLEIVNKGIPDYTKLNVRHEPELQGYLQAVREIRQKVEEL